MNSSSTTKKVKFIPNPNVIIIPNPDWQNHYLPDCSIDSLSFEPIKNCTTRIKIKITKFQNDDRPFHLLDRTKVRINIHFFKNILCTYSVSDLFIMILQLIC